MLVLEPFVFWFVCRFVGNGFCIVKGLNDEVDLLGLDYDDMR